MGRLTELIEYLNKEPKELQKAKESGLFSRIEIGDEMKKARRNYRKPN